MRHKFLLLLVGLFLACFTPSAWAQNPYTNEELDQLVGPIALYPDPLLTNVIVAATQPQQVLAARSGQKDSNWDSSVQALESYPDVLAMMADNQDWMKAVGWASANQVSDLMDAVQRFRYQAQNAGNLKTNDKMQVIEEGSILRIESASPEVVYVPTYDPYAVTQSYYPGLAFGVGVATSALLWNNMYHWNNGSFYHSPVGWRPTAGYYRPYGWQGAGCYGAGSAYRPYGNVNRPANFNNVNVNNVRVNNANINRGNVNTGNINRGNVNTGNINRGNVNTGNINRGNINSGNVNRGNYNSGNMNRGNYSSGNMNRGNYSGGNRPAVPQARPSMSPGYNRSNASASRGSGSGFSNYSSSGSSTRQSQRGASSRNMSSMSSGSRGGGGGRRR